MSILISSTFKLLRSQLFNNTMEKTVLLELLEERINKAETTVRQLQNQIDSMKQDLQSLKRDYPVNDTVQKRSFSTASLKSFDDSNSETKKTKFSFDKNNGHVIVYTDGACPSNGKYGAKAGIGVWFGDNHPLNVAKLCSGRQTNNAAEILACAEACKVASANGIDKLEINTDSQFTINCITKWMKNWKKNNWKTAAGKDVINKDDLLLLERYSNALSSVTYKHVSAHKGIKGNEAADKLAVQGASMSEVKIEN